MKLTILFFLILITSTISAQLPAIEPGVSQNLAKWRSARYSDIHYKLDLTLEKMSPVLKGHMEIRVSVSSTHVSEGQSPQSSTPGGSDTPPIILDWRKLPGHEKDSTVSNITLNGSSLTSSSAMSPGFSRPDVNPNSTDANAGPPEGGTHSAFEERSEHLIFHDGVRMGENVITLDFTSPILTSGSAITRYIDKEDGSEYIYSLFVPSDASTAFPVFDQPDLKARFSLTMSMDASWQPISNNPWYVVSDRRIGWSVFRFEETKPMSTYVFAFAAGPWTQVSEPGTVVTGSVRKVNTGFVCPPDTTCDPIITAADIEKLPTQPATSSVATNPVTTVPGSDTRADLPLSVYVRRSQAAKFQPHAAETFRLTREAIKYLETYFDYKFPWPKYDLVLIPEFPFGGMEHAGATFLRESSVIFPTEPTKGDEISRANVIFHETAHQWFGDLVTMRWFDDLWLKEGFAEFMAYKTLEHVMPDANALKVFYERNKQAAYATDSTRGTTPIYQPIANLASAKSAYGNIVYRKAPSFLRQAEFYLGQDKFQTAVRAFLKKHEYANATWQDLVGEFERASGQRLQEWGKQWVTQPGLPKLLAKLNFGRDGSEFGYSLEQTNAIGGAADWKQKTKLLRVANGGTRFVQNNDLPWEKDSVQVLGFARDTTLRTDYYFPNYGDYGYGIFLLDDKSREYVLHNIQNEKDPFLRSMMWGALWDSVREAEMDPREYVELVIKNLPTEPDETTVASLLGRVSTALNYYVSDAGGNPSSSEGVTTSKTATKNTLPTGRVSALRAQFESVILDRMQHAETPGLRATFFRAFVANASTEHGREVLKQMLREGGNPSGSEGAPQPKMPQGTLPTGRVSASPATPILRAKDKFDIVTRLIILGDPDAPRLLAELEKTETSDDAKRYAYAAHAAFPTAENRAKFWKDFVNNKDISESWIEAAIGPFNSIHHPELSQPYLARSLAELPNLKRTRKIFFINNWLAAWLSGQRDQAALDIVNKFLADNPNLDNDLRLKVLENVDVIERAVRIRQRYAD